MAKQLSENFKLIIDNAKLASDGIVLPKHLIIGMFEVPESMACKVLKYYGLNMMLDSSWKNGKTLENKTYNIITQTADIIEQASVEAARLKSDMVCSEHLLLAVVRSKLLDDRLKTSDVELIIAKLKNENLEDDSDEPEYDINGDPNLSHPNNKKGILEKFCVNLNEKAKAGKLDPIIGRDKELKRVEQILSRRTKNNPVLIGEPGVGKTAIVNYLAQKIVAGDVCEQLLDKQILVMDMSTIVAGTKFRGEFEERLKLIVDEITKNGNYIVYIDEVHTIVGAGSSAGSQDAANLLKPALTRGEFSCIGSTTLKEYRQIEKDGALERRFQKVIIEEPTMQETKAILYSIKDKYEDFHGVSYSDEIIAECLTLSNRYLYERKFPDKAIDILDEVGSYVKIRKQPTIERISIQDELNSIIKKKCKYVAEKDFKEAAILRKTELELREKLEKLKNIELQDSEKLPITLDDIYNVISTMTGIPSKNITEDELAKFVSLENNIKSVFVGQDESVDKVTRSLIRNKAGLGNTNKPIGVFLFTGGTGVGKTFLAKLLAKNLFNSEEDIIRVDMSEYMEKSSVSKLIGAAPGYVGYEEGGQLTEKVRRKPYSIVLLDEVEKAHSDVWNILLQVFDDGMLTDAQGKTVSFKNTIIIMTSNVGSKKAQQFSRSVGFSANTEANSTDIIDKEIKTLFSPEFLNRIDEIIKFNPLTKDDIKRIINIELNNFSTRLLYNNGINITFDDSCGEFILSRGWDSNMGARPIKRTIQRFVEDEVSMIILQKAAKSSDSIAAHYVDGSDKITFDIKKDELLSFDTIKVEVPSAE